MTKEVTRLHTEAAEHLREAADHHRQAAEHHEQEAHTAALEHAELARGHVVQAVTRADEAATIHANADRGTEHGSP